MLIREEIEAKINLYSLLSLVFIEEAKIDFVREIDSGELGVELKRLGFYPLHDLKAISRERQVEELGIEYTYLFIGPGEYVSPYESVILGEGRHWGDKTVDVLHFYQKAGYKPASSTIEFPDHIGIEFEFLAHLSKRELESVSVGDNDKELKMIRDLQKRFLAEHLTQVLPPFNKEVQKQARLAYYKSFTELALNIYI